MTTSRSETTMAFRVDPDPPLPAAAGGKARGLQLIARAGLRHARAWVVLPGASEISARAVADDFAGRGVDLLAVRSSARDEDDARSSFAGVHESLLGVPVRDLETAIERVAASALSERARSYREQMGLPPPPGPCAAVVQPMVPSELAGVAFTEGPDDDGVAIEAVEGLGDTAADGRVVPERLVLRRSHGLWRVDRRAPRTQAFATAVRSGGVARVSLPPERQHDPLLTPERAVEIAEGVERLQRLAGRPLDVEWAWADGGVWFLQARPRTRPLQSELPAGEVWSRANAREVLPDIPSAFTRSVVAAGLDGAMRDLLRKHGLRDAKAPLFAFVYGRPVFNERGLSIGEALGVSREATQAQFGGTGTPDNSARALRLRVALRHPIVLFRTVLVALGAERGAQRFIETLRATRQEIATVDLSRATDGQLLKPLLELRERVPRPWAFHGMAVAEAVANAQYPVLMRLRRHPTPWALLARLVADGEGSVSTRQVDELLDLARAMRAWPDREAFTREITTEHASARHWQAHLPEHVWERVARWLERYGHRGPFESDLSMPRHADDLRLLAAALFPLVETDVAFSRTPEGRHVEAVTAWQEIEHLAGRWARPSIRRGVRKTKRLMALRERFRSEAMAMMHPARRVALELGRRLVAQGRLRELEDVWHLSLDELRRTVEEPRFVADVAVARELARCAAWRRLEVPNRFRSEEIASLATRGVAQAGGATTLRGNGISPGVVEGPVCVLETPTDGHRFTSGAVLVAPATDPGWTPLFARAAGIVVEIGGALSHAGIVAREYGLPCVANIEGVMRMLRDGDVVRIDGSSGVVSVVSRAAAPADPSLR